MDSKTTIQCNKLIQLDNSMLMYGIYKAETLEKLTDTVHNIHNITSYHETAKLTDTQIILCKFIRFTSLFHKFQINILHYTGN